MRSNCSTNICIEPNPGLGSIRPQQISPEHLFERRAGIKRRPRRFDWISRSRRVPGRSKLTRGHASNVLMKPQPKEAHRAPHARQSFRKLDRRRTDLAHRGNRDPHVRAEVDKRFEIAAACTAFRWLPGNRLPCPVVQSTGNPSRRRRNRPARSPGKL